MYLVHHNSFSKRKKPLRTSTLWFGPIFTSDKSSLFQSNFQTIYNISNQTGNHTRSRKKSKFIAYFFTLQIRWFFYYVSSGSVCFHEYKNLKTKKNRSIRTIWNFFLMYFAIVWHKQILTICFAWFFMIFVRYWILWKFIDNPCFNNHSLYIFCTKSFLFVCLIFFSLFFFLNHTHTMATEIGTHKKNSTTLYSQWYRYDFTAESSTNRLLSALNIQAHKASYCLTYSQKSMKLYKLQQQK